MKSLAGFMTTCKRNVLAGVRSTCKRHSMAVDFRPILSFPKFPIDFQADFS